ncbi:unnamed protein product, partial [Cyprideis torosa]
MGLQESLEELELRVATGSGGPGSLSGTGSDGMTSGNLLSEATSAGVPLEVKEKLLRLESENRRLNELRSQEVSAVETQLRETTERLEQVSRSHRALEEKLGRLEATK